MRILQFQTTEHHQNLHMQKTLNCLVTNSKVIQENN